MRALSRHPSLKFLDKPYAVMAIVNVTPDSFFDGGALTTKDSAVQYALECIRQGAHILDIGGESTRPGAQAVSAQEEMARVVGVIAGIRHDDAHIPISIDTTKALVAAAALDAGATVINDISAGRFDTAMPMLAAQRACPVILMHSRHTPDVMQTNPGYGDAVAEVRGELEERIDVFVKAGVSRDAIIIDPGIGFAKRREDNIALIRHVDRLVACGYPVLLGASRKSFLGAITGKNVDERLAGSLAAVAAAYARGVRFFRVHDVAPTRDFLEVLHCMG